MVFVPDHVSVFTGNFDLSVVFVKVSETGVAFDWLIQGRKFLMAVRAVPVMIGNFFFAFRTDSHNFYLHYYRTLFPVWLRKGTVFLLIPHDSLRNPSFDTKYSTLF